MGKIKQRRSKQQHPHHKTRAALGRMAMYMLLFRSSEKKVIRSRSAKNGSILYEDFDLRNEVTVTFLFSFLAPMGPQV
jgi:hypothetical protein